MHATTALHGTFQTKGLGDDLYAKYRHLLEPGDLLIAGVAANTRVDRDDEAFLPGALDESLKAFIAEGGALIHHHAKSQVLGRVLDAHSDDSGQVHVVARVDKQNAASPMYWTYCAIRKGSIRNFSFGGYMSRIRTAAGMRIRKMDVTELSTTSTPVGRGTSLSVVAEAKALRDDPLHALRLHAAAMRLESALDALNRPDYGCKALADARGDAAARALAVLRVRVALYEVHALA